MGPNVREREVRRLLERYLVEVVERWSLCPWAFAARTRGELAVEIGWGASCTGEHAAHLARRGLERPGATVIMVVFPELVGGGPAIDALRDEVARRVPEAGVAAFGPHGELDVSTSARLVPALRRSPDPMLQLVPFAILDELRREMAPPPLPEREAQARALAGHAEDPAPSGMDGIARRNHAAIAPDRGEELDRVIGKIAADRAVSYKLVGIARPAIDPAIDSALDPAIDPAIAPIIAPVI